MKSESNLRKTFQKTFSLVSQETQLLGVERFLKAKWENNLSVDQTHIFKNILMNSGKKKLLKYQFFFLRQTLRVWL